MAGRAHKKSGFDEFQVMTEDEAFALALEMCPEGESFSVHEAKCAVTPEDPTNCTCVPTTYKPGAKA